MPNFKDLRIVDNFYQTSSFIPMPTILISTLTDDEETSIGSYSLCFPYYVAGKDYYAMLLQCRNNSNTAQNILKHKTCALNFIPDKKSYFKEAVRLGFPGDTSKEKMKDCLFTLLKPVSEGLARPQIIDEAFQVFECTWDDTLDEAFNDQAGEMDGYPEPYRQFNGITSKFGAHFILKIDKILMEDKYQASIINGLKAKDFPKLPVDYGYRDNTHFWYTPFKKPISEKVPEKEGDINTIIYAADRLHSDVKFTDDACAMLIKVPRIFLNTVLKAAIDYAKENDISLITPEVMTEIQDKRNAEKKR